MELHVFVWILVPVSMLNVIMREISL